ncbi:MAG: nucleotidyltransferase domain-containing protein [Thermoprotei archaeon]
MSSSRFRYYRLSTGEKEKLVDKIRNILLREERIELVLIFGSFVENEYFHDIDIAVYGPSLDLDYILRLGGLLELETGYPIDLIPLDQITPRFRHYVLVYGKIVLEKKSGVYEALLSQTLDEIYLLEHVD